MTHYQSSFESLRRVFHQGFVARDIAEPLVSCDATMAAAEARAWMETRDFDVLGVRRGGLICGFVARSNLDGATCGDAEQSFNDETQIADDAPLACVIQGLSRAPRLFVRVLGTVGGIVTLSDLQKPPVRMWLFGIVTLVEMRMSRLVEQMCPGDDWRQYVSAARMEKAVALLEERRRRSQDLRLIDCLQFGDKAQIVARCEAIRRLTRFDSRRQVEAACRALENLRNNLAHAQDILASDWETIVLLSTDIDAVIFGTQAVQAAIDGRPQLTAGAKDGAGECGGGE